jgi:hypothetical protein
LKPEAVSVLASENIQDEEHPWFYRDLMVRSWTLYHFIITWRPANTTGIIEKRSAGMD